MPIIKIEKSTDGMTEKHHYQLDDVVIQLVLVKRPDKNIVCFPSQVGCKFSCIFCKAKAWKRNLTAEEILDSITETVTHIDNENHTLFSCMGEGDPGYSVDAIGTVFDTLAVDYPDCRMAVSTTLIPIGLVNRLNNHAGRMKMQLSLHSAKGDIKEKLMPGSPAPLIAVGRLARFDGDMEFNLLLLSSMNDRNDEALLIHYYARSAGASVKINKLNSEEYTESIKVPEYMAYFRNLRPVVPIEYYETDGDDIAATCGNLTHE